MSSSRRFFSNNTSANQSSSSAYPGYPPPPYPGTGGGSSFPTSNIFPTFGLNNLANSINNLTSSLVNNPTISNLMSGGGSGPSSRMNYPSSSSGRSGSSSNGSQVSCDTCGTRLGLFYRKKKTCGDCQKDYCTSCFNSYGSQQDSSSSYHTRESYADPRIRKFCRRCRVFNQWPLDKRSLSNLRVKDLRWYLERRHVNVAHCKEKSELVDMILRCNGLNPASYTEPSTPTSSYRMQRRVSAEADPFVERRTSAPSRGQQTDNNSSSSNTSTESWEVIGEDRDNSSRRGSERRNRVSRSPTASDRVRVEDFFGDEETGGESRGATGYSRPSGEEDTGTAASNPNNSTDEIPPERQRDTQIRESKETSVTSGNFKAFNIEDIELEDQIRELTARQLKLILTRNFVDYKGCCERDELMDKVLRLWREKKDIKEKINQDEIPDENLCKICMESVVDCVLLECGHMISCVNCGKRLAECPICRQYVVRAVRIFRS